MTVKKGRGGFVRHLFADQKKLIREKLGICGDKWPGGWSEGGESLKRPEGRDAADDIGWHHPGPCRWRQADASWDLPCKRHNGAHPCDEEQQAESAPLGSGARCRKTKRPLPTSPRSLNSRSFHRVWGAPCAKGLSIPSSDRRYSAAAARPRSGVDCRRRCPPSCPLYKEKSGCRGAR